MVDKASIQGRKRFIMKENPSPDPGKQRVFSPKRPVVALLVMMVGALSFALLFASVGKT
jgi:hypothetical protein